MADSVRTMSNAQAWTMLTGNGANCYTSEERFYVSVVIMIGSFTQVHCTAAVVASDSSGAEEGARSLPGGGGGQHCAARYQLR